VGSSFEPKKRGIFIRRFERGIFIRKFLHGIFIRERSEVTPYRPYRESVPGTTICCRSTFPFVPIRLNYAAQGSSNEFRIAAFSHESQKGEHGATLLALRDSTSRTAGIVPDVSCLGTRPCLVFGVVYTLVGYILLAGILHPGYPAAGILHRYLGISRTLVMPGAAPCIPMYPAACIPRTWTCSYIDCSCCSTVPYTCILLLVSSSGT